MRSDGFSVAILDRAEADLGACFSLSLAKAGLGIELEQVGQAPNTQLKVTGIVPGKGASLPQGRKRRRL